MRGLATGLRGLPAGLRGLPAGLRGLPAGLRGLGRAPAPPAVPPTRPDLPSAPPVPLPEVITVPGPVHAGAFCSIEGSWARGTDGRLLRCVPPVEGGRARWRPPA
jgi:hypothetical protein